MPEQNADLNASLNRLTAIVVRRRWWILLTTCIISLGAIRVSFLLPNRYRSEATIFVAKPRVPEQYIVPNNTANSMESVDAITRQVLSRARLTQIIDEFGLYPRMRHLGPDALADLMRNDIEVQPMSKDPERRPMNALLVSFTGDTPQVAQRVTDRITSLFIEENVQTQQDLDTGTTNFLQQQLDAAKGDLDQQEEQIRAYKMRNLGELPEQEGANLEVLSGLQMQLQTAEANLARARQQHAYLEAMLGPYVQTSASHLGHDTGPTASVATLREQLAHLRSQRDELLVQYSPLYPDVVGLNQRIASLEARLNRATAPAAEGAKKASTADALESLSDPSAIQLRSQLQANAMEIEDTQRQAAQAREQISIYQKRLTFAPIRDQQQQEVLRNYDLAKQNYANLLNKKTQSEMATKLASQQRDKQFQIIDPASLPLKPSSPNREKIALGSLAAGLLAGLALAFLIDTRDRSFRFDSDVRGHLALPLVIGIPLLHTPEEQRKIAQRAGLQWALACLLLLTLLSAQIYIFQKG